jgi:hypothetical protein
MAMTVGFAVIGAFVIFNLCTNDECDVLIKNTNTKPILVME